MSDFQLGIVNLKNAKHVKDKKISAELMSIAWLLKKDGGILAWQKIRKKK